MRQLSEAERRILQDMLAGWTLKSHRDVEGNKVFQLHALDGTTEGVNWEAVEALQEAGLIDSNKKFPAATYWVTEAGKKHVGA